MKNAIVCEDGSVLPVLEKFEEQGSATHDGLRFTPAVFQPGKPKSVGILIEAPSGKALGWTKPTHLYCSPDSAGKFVKAVVDVYDNILTEEQRMGFKVRSCLC